MQRYRQHRQRGNSNSLSATKKGRFRHVSIALQLYAPLNIFVALVGIVVWSEKDEIQISVKGDETLTNFLHYRRVRLSKEHPNDNAQLLT